MQLIILIRADIMRKPKHWQEVRRKYWWVVDQILKESDLVLNVLDARYYQETRNPELEKRIKIYGKKFIFILNKSDLVSQEKLREAYDELSKVKLTLPMSCRDRRGKLRLIKAITRKVKKRPMTIGVVGYPNTGKSSVINYLAGKKSARTSSVAGFTRGMQWIRLSKNFLLIDTPGVIPMQEKSESNLALKSAVTAVKDYEQAACKILNLLIKTNKKAIEKRYGISVNAEGIETLNQIAKYKGRLKKHGELDIESAARLIVNDWQKGKLKL